MNTKNTTYHDPNIPFIEVTSKYLDDGNSIVKILTNAYKNKYVVEVVYFDIDDTDWKEFKTLDKAKEQFENIISE